MMPIEVKLIPAFKDNYIHCICNSMTKEAIVVDPGDALPMIQALAQFDLSLRAILITHKHQDHIGGIPQLLENLQTNPPVFAGKYESIPKIVSHPVAEPETISFDQWPLIHVIDVPGHTLGHVTYLIENKLFCGDTLFGAGCGRLFEGTPAEMLNSLNKIKSLSDETLIYCAHEYTLQNLAFAKMLEPKNTKIIARDKETTVLRENGIPSVPSTLRLEKETNPFLRCDQPDVIKRAEEYAGKIITNESEVFKYIREWRNSY